MYLTLIHLGGGSMVEGADAADIFGPFKTEKEADLAGKTYYNITKSDPFLRDEMWWTVVEIPNPANLSMEKSAKKMLKEQAMYNGNYGEEE